MRRPWVRRWALPLVGLLLTAAVSAGLMARGEARIATGEPIFLALAPVDPRAPLVGDYMALRYEVAVDATHATWGGLEPSSVDETAGPATSVPPRGLLVIRVDDRAVASFDRFATTGGELLQPDERLLQYRTENGEIAVASPAWFIPEGQGAVYNDAKYGEIRLQPDGSSILVGLRDGDLQPLGTPRAPLVR